MYKKCIVTIAQRPREKQWEYTIASPNKAYKTSESIKLYMRFSCFT